MSRKSNTMRNGVRRSEVDMRFASAEGITFEDAIHHLLVSGTTGAGKTASVVLPVLAILCSAARRVSLKGMGEDQ